MRITSCVKVDTRPPLRSLRRRAALASLAAAIAATLGAVAVGLTATSSAAAEPAVAERPGIVPIVITEGLEALGARTLLRQAVSYAARHLVKRELERWIASRGTFCPNGLQRLYFCAGRPPAIHAVALAAPADGYAGIYEYSSPKPREARARLGLLRGAPIGLSCYDIGDYADGSLGSSMLWYRTWRGWYVAAAQVDTGTTDGLGLPPC
jgi:hypothetical protein